MALGPRNVNGDDMRQSTISEQAGLHILFGKDSMLRMK